MAGKNPAIGEGLSSDLISVATNSTPGRRLLCFSERNINQPPRAAGNLSFPALMKRADVPSGNQPGERWFDRLSRQAGFSHQVFDCAPSFIG